MDKITTAINNWLLQYDPIKDIAEVNTEELPNNENTLALQRSGVENIPLKYLSEKGWNRQYQYMLLLKKFSESNSQRIENLDWLDDLSNWIDEQNIKSNFPIIEGIKVYEVSCANALTYGIDEEGAISTYNIQLYFNIKGGI